MNATRKVLLLYSDERPVHAGTALDLPRLCDALRARGAEVEEALVDSAPDALLDHLQGGAVAVLFRGDRRA